jgi:hypothetical protein
MVIVASHHGAIVDSGASSHFFADREKFVTYQTLDKPIEISAADGRTFRALA